MSTIDEGLTSGISGLDKALKGVLAGDNIVWQIDSIEEYQELVTPYCEAAVKNGRKLVYFRYARHDALVTEDMGAEIHVLDQCGQAGPFVARLGMTRLVPGQKQFRRLNRIVRRVVG